MHQEHRSRKTDFDGTTMTQMLSLHLKLKSLYAMQQPKPPRKLMRRREIPGGVRCITFSCQRRLQLLTNHNISQLFVDAMACARSKHHVEIFAWVVMPEHVHLLCRPPKEVPLDRVLLGIKMSVAKRVLERWKALNAPILAEVTDATGRPRFWQKGGGFDRNVRDNLEFAREVKYVHHNPVERGLVVRPEAWPWSSVRWWMGQRDGEFVCDPPPGQPGAWDSWTGYV